MNTSPSSGSALNGGHGLVLPEYFHDSFSHVSTPGSLPCGTVWKIHFGAPVTTSNACTCPAGISGAVGRSNTVQPTTTELPTIIGGALKPTKRRSSSLRISAACRSTRPSLPNDAIGCPERASIAISSPVPVAIRMRCSVRPPTLPDQYATPRCCQPEFAGRRPTRYACGSKTQRVAPVPASIAATSLKAVLV